MRLIARSLSYAYGREHAALKSLDFSLDKGVIGLVGANGAGKSTLMRLLATLLRPASGQVEWQGKDIHRHPAVMRRALGYLPQNFGFYPQLSASEFLLYLAAVKGVAPVKARAQIAQYMACLNLSGSDSRRLSDYSGGMRQRVGIIQALLGEPQILMLDEPTVGLDPEERIRFRNLMVELGQSKIVLLSSHIMSDISTVATHILHVDKGAIIADESPADYLRRAKGTTWQFLATEEDYHRLDQGRVSSVHLQGDQLLVRYVSDERPSDAAVPVPTTVEDAYLYLANRKAGD